MNRNGAGVIGEELHEHELHSQGRAAYPVVLCLLGITECCLYAMLRHHHYWLAVPLVLISSHLMHGVSIGFHEASHGLLRKNRMWNELDGVLLGTFGFMSFSLYRSAHQTHHAHLGTERDEELWPFVHPGIPRWLRVVAAVLELSCGFLFTPVIFARSFLRNNSPIRSKKVRKRIWWEFALIAVFWTTALWAVTVAGVWKYFLWMYVAPVWIAGNLQSWRKYVEHVGLTGSTVRSATRSIVADDVWGKLVSFTLLHEPYHGVHHLRVGLPHAELPAHAEDLQPANTEEHPPFRSYGHAARHLMHCLSDPRVGAQWVRARS